LLALVLLPLLAVRVLLPLLAVRVSAQALVNFQDSRLCFLWVVAAATVAEAAVAVVQGVRCPSSLLLHLHIE